MADAITMQGLIDANLDVETLGEAANEDKVVVSRLGREFVSAPMASRIILEQGTIDATLKTTKAALDADTLLVDDDFALVYNDDDIDLNGYYQKQSGVWEYLPYNLQRQALNQIEQVKQALSEKINNTVGMVSLAKKIQTGKQVKPTYGGGVLGVDANYDTVLYDVEGVDEVTISGADDTLGWEWLVTDTAINNRVLISGVFGNGTIKIPTNGKWLIRNYQSRSAGVIESSVVVSKKFAKTIKDVSDDVDTKADKYTSTRELVINPINGALVNNNRASSGLLSYGSGRQYIAYDVSNIDQLTISGAKDDNPNFEWVFANDISATALRHSFAEFKGNGVLKIPDGVKFALRSYYYQGDANNPLQSENVGMTINATLSSPNVAEWKELVESVNTTGNKIGYAKKVIAESGLNLYKLSSFEGADSHEKIDNAIALIKLSGNGGILDLESGVHKRRSAILMPDNFWLYLNDSKLMLEDGVHDNLIRNEGIVINPDPYGFALELNENRNIRVFGNGEDRSYIFGPTVPKTAPHPINGGAAVPWVGDWYGWRTLEINLVNVKDYGIHGFSLVNSRCWGITQQHGCENFEIHDIKFSNTVKNGDGIDVLQGCKNGRVYNISGRTQDDMVALSAINGFVTSLPQFDYIYPMLIGGWVDRGFGVNIENVKVENIVGSGSYHGVRLLASGGSKIKNVSINKVHEDAGKGYRVATVIAGTGYGTNAVMGDMIDITINDIKSDQAIQTLKLNGPLKNVWFNDVAALTSESLVLSTSTSLYSAENVVFTKISGQTESY